MNDRPAARPAFVIAGILILVLLTGLLAWRVAARHRLEQSRERFLSTVRELGIDVGPRSGLPPGAENGVRWLRAATGLLDAGCVRTAINPLPAGPATAWTPGEREAAQRCIEANREVLDLLHRAVRCPDTDWELENSLDAEMPPLLELIQCSRLLRVSAELHLDRGEQGPAFDDMAAIAAIARSLEDERPLICTLVGVAAENQLLTALHEAVASGGVAPGVRAAGALLPRTDLVTAVRRSLAWETTALTDAVTDSRLSDLLDSATGSSRTFRIVLGHMASAAGLPWRETLLADLYDRGTANLGVAGTSYRELAANPPLLPTVHFPATLAVSSAFLGNPAFAVIAAGRAQETMAMRHLARAALALADHARETGRWPSTLPPPLAARQLFCDCTPTMEPREDGGLRLVLPGARELSDRLWKRAGITPSHPMTWEIPPSGPRLLSHAPKE